MPLTFIDIERRKNWRIAIFFLVLLALYLAVAMLIAIPFLSGFLFSSVRFWSATIIAAVIAAAVHFWFSASNAVDSVIRGLGALPPDTEDEFHRMFLNVVDEIRIVTGNRRSFRCAVIPSLSMNALAVADLRGNAMVAITEGLLSRLTRPQTEAVVAHEAHHILSGDCLEATIAASVFGTLSSFLERVRLTSQNRVFSVPAFLLAWLVLQFGYLLNMFISREREYRADAASVRMTRNPLALAETLHLLSRSWRGAGFIGSGYEMLCIVNPQVSRLDETEGFWSNLFSTHPPLVTRMDILLRMAKINSSDLDRRSAERSAAPAIPSGEYYALSPRQEWQGPFRQSELAAMPWLTPLTWIVSGQEPMAIRAWKDPFINAVFLQRLSTNERAPSVQLCPLCRQPLVSMTYEGTTLLQCTFCAGTLVQTTKIPRIIARTDMSPRCTERVMLLARTVLRENLSKRLYARRSQESSGPPLFCPTCGHPMLRRFYSISHLIEIDQCSLCGITWFDQSELEMLQCMIRNRLTPTIPPHYPTKEEN